MQRSDGLTLVLVSASPRRREMLSARRFRLEIASPPDSVEEISTGDARSLVTENARRKVRTYLEWAGIKKQQALRKVFLGVDTIVEYEGDVLGKPGDEQEAYEMIRRLSASSHFVYSALHLFWPGTGEKTLCRRTEVRFRPLSHEEISFYVSTGEPLDKAGAYGIQGLAGLFVEEIRGCYYNVVGLPLAGLCEALTSLGVPLSRVIEPAME